MLSPFVALRVHSAKHLDAHRDRPFASLGVTIWDHPIHLPASYTHTVMLSAAKHLDTHQARPFAALRVTAWHARSESVLHALRSGARSNHAPRPVHSHSIVLA